MTPNEEKESWQYFAIKKLYALLKGITSTRGDFYCFNCLHDKVCKNKYFLWNSNVIVKE